MITIGFLDSLQDVKARFDRPETQDRVKATWFQLKASGDSAKVTFLQELDESSPKYSAKNGKARFVTEHSNPDNFRKKAVCTADEGYCYGCEQKWTQKVVLYINVLVDNGVDEPFVAVWSRGYGRGSAAAQLVEIAGDEDFGYAITDKTFKITRLGSGTDTTYTLAILGPSAKDVEAFDLFKIEDVVFHVKPETQEKYFTDGEAKATVAAKSTPPFATTSKPEPATLEW